MCAWFALTGLLGGSVYALHGLGFGGSHVCFPVVFDVIHCQVSSVYGVSYCRSLPLWGENLPMFYELLLLHMKCLISLILQVTHWSSRLATLKLIY